MKQYNNINVKITNSQLHKLKSEIKNKTEEFLGVSSNITKLFIN